MADGAARAVSGCKSSPVPSVGNFDGSPDVQGMLKIVIQAKVRQHLPPTIGFLQQKIRCLSLEP